MSNLPLFEQRDTDINEDGNGAEACFPKVEFASECE